MKIRKRLTLLYTFITAAILLIFAAVIYLSAKEAREKEFYTSLKKEAITKAKLHFNAKVPDSTLQDIYRSNRQILNEVEVAIYDLDFNLFYHDAEDIDLVKETPEMIREVYELGEMEFYQDDWQVVGIPYQFQSKTYVITATAIDLYGYAKLENLLQTIIIVFIFSVLIIYFTGRYFSGRALDPVKEMIDNANSISGSSLELRLPAGKNQDELYELAETFNEMLDRIENSFEAQKHFVSNISHEIRTPLAAIITELELSLMKEKNADDFKLAVQNALQDSKRLVKLSNNLLDFAKASYDPSEISFKEIRIDEVLLDAGQVIQQAYPKYEVAIGYNENLQDISGLTTEGNEYLLKTAFVNLIENACKFSSDHRCEVSISQESGRIEIDFSDKGIGISEEDFEHLFTAFYRGKNGNLTEGNGIGLALTKKIIDLHQGNIQVQSSKDFGTTFRIIL